MALQNLPLTSITPSSNNPRKYFDAYDMSDLTASVARFGVMQPIIVRPQGDGYELVCGERRYRASIDAGLADIPAIVRDLTDDEAFDLQITENLQRKDINPMEESDAFQALMKRGMTKAKDIAKRFGKSETYVYDRLALQRCIPDIQDGIRLGAFPVSMGKQFARLTIDDQQQLFDNLAKPGKLLDLADVKRAIDTQFTYTLEDAPFSTHNPNLLPKAGPCISCPKRSGCNQLLFDDVSSKDICFDKSCYDMKVEAHIAHLEQELKDAGMEVHRVSLSYSVRPEGALTRSEFDQLDKTDDGYADCKTVGIVVAKPTYDDSIKIGQVIKIELEKPDDDDDANEDDDDSNEAAPSSGVKSVAKKQPELDPNELLTAEIVLALMAEFQKSNALALPREMALKLCKRKVRNISDPAKKTLGMLLGLVTNNSNGDYDEDISEENLNDYLQSVAHNELIGLLHVLSVVDEIEQWSYDKDDIREVTEALSSFGIDAKPLIDSVQTKCNFKFIDE